MSRQTIEPFLEVLSLYPSSKNVFNPWRDHLSEIEIGPEASLIRRRQLHAYLSSRQRTARFLLLAEALGFQGGRFTGIPMTTERFLLGHLQHHGLQPAMALDELPAERTSLPSVRPDGFTEPTSTIVWNTLVQSGHDIRQFVFWNIFPWHPFQPEKGPLSNRTPTPRELKTHLEVLKHFLRLFPKITIIALGRKAAQGLNDLGVPHKVVRHPARGGARQFQSQLQRLL